MLGKGYVETETDWRLANSILSGAWCLVLGHEQSGKSSTVAAAQEIVRASGEHIQLLHISLQDGYAGSGELWHYLADRMHGIDPDRFPLADPAQLTTDPLSLMWEWFRPCEGRTAVAIAIDEAALLGSVQDIVQVMAEFRALREEQNQLRSVVFVGTEAVARLMDAVKRDAPRYYSPFTWVSLSIELELRHLGCAELAWPACISDLNKAVLLQLYTAQLGSVHSAAFMLCIYHCGACSSHQTRRVAVQNSEIMPAPFTEAQTRQLLSEYAELRKVHLAPGIDDWAAEIWQRTHGHRGLTTSCGARLEAGITNNALFGERPVQLDRWLECARTELPGAACEEPVVSALQELQCSLEALDGREDILELLELVRSSVSTPLCICRAAAV